MPNLPTIYYGYDLVNYHDFVAMTRSEIIAAGYAYQQVNSCAAGRPHRNGRPRRTSGNRVWSKSPLSKSQWNALAKEGRKPKFEATPLSEVLARINEEQIPLRLIQETYQGLAKPASWVCQVCRFPFTNKPQNILNRKQGCKRCKGFLTPTMRQVNQKLKQKGNPWELLKEPQNVKERLPWHCHFHDAPFTKSVTKVINNNQGCLDCGKLRTRNALGISLQECIKRLKGRDIALVNPSSYETAGQSQLLQCLVDPSHEPWKTSPSRTWHGDEPTGCPTCSNKKRVTQKDVENALIGRPLKLVKFNDGAHGESIFRCLADPWHPDRSISNTNVYRLGVGCWYCGHERTTQKQTHSHAQFMELFKERNPKWYGRIHVFGRYIKDRKKIAVQCKECLYPWTPTAGGLLSGKGCPSCARTGFNPAIPAVLYLIPLFHRSHEDVYGFGISNVFNARYRQHQANIKRADFTHGEPVLIDFMVGAHAETIEALLKKRLNTNHIVPIEGFLSEAFFAKELPKALEIIHKTKLQLDSH